MTPSLFQLQYNTLRREIFKTGGGEVDDDSYLSPIEEAMLDYVGVEGVTGELYYIPTT